MRTFATAVAFWVLAIHFAAQSSLAAIINVTSHGNDASLLDSTLNGVGNSTFEIATGRLLAGGGGSGHFVGVMYFQLPAIGMNEFLADANLRLTVTADLNTTAANRADVYGLGYLTTTPPAAIPTNWFSQSANDTRTGAMLGTNIGSTPITKIADDFLLGGTAISAGTAFNTNPTQDSVLTNFLQSLYAQGAQAGDYAVFRINLDANPAGAPPAAVRFEIGSANNATAAFRPLLTFDIQELPPAPEPSSLLLLTWGILGLRKVRRRG